MDIHKPKAAHSWREFLIEIGTIICGILIALGLEQAVEELHARHETEQLDSALRIEVIRNLGEAIQQASMFTCVRSQTATAVDRLSKTADWPGAEPMERLKDPSFNGFGVFRNKIAPDAMTLGRGLSAPPPSFSPAPGVPSIIPFAVSDLISRSWLTAASTPGLAHMDRRRRDRFALIYYYADSIEAAITQMVEARRDLAALAFPQQLSPSDRRDYIRTLSRFDSANRHVYTDTGLLLAEAEQNGLRPDEHDVAERLSSLRSTYGDCVSRYLMPKRAPIWVKKLESDRDRFGGSAD